MAIWQFAIIVLPKKQFSEEHSGTGDRLTKSDYEKIDFWKETHLDKSTFDVFGNVLPRGKSWSDDIHLFGSTDSNCIEIIEDNGKVSEIIARLDMRTDYDTVLSTLVEFAIQNSMYLFDNELEKLPLNATSIHFHILNSEIYRAFQEIKGRLEEV